MIPSVLTLDIVKRVETVESSGSTTKRSCVMIGSRKLRNSPQTSVPWCWTPFADLKLNVSASLMLKTTEQQQDTLPDEYSAERVVPVEEKQPTQITAGEQVLEPERT